MSQDPYSCPDGGEGAHRRDFLACDLIVPVPAVDGALHCADVLQRLVDNAAWPGLAITDAQGRIEGMVSRARLFGDMARPYIRDIYARRPIRQLMDDRPLVVEASETLDAIGRRIAEEKPDALVDGFVIVRDGHYVGLGTAIDFLRKGVEQVERRAVQLEDARRIAEEASTAKSSFLANMSHEIRTPLNGVLANLELLRFTEMSPEQTELAQSANHAAQTLLHIIGDVLDFSKIEAGKLEVEWVDLNPADLLQDVIVLLNGQARTRGLWLNAFAGLNLPRLVKGDPLRLRQVLINLVGNAIKFTRQGGVRLCLTRLDDGQGRRATLRFMVSDTGAGFAPEKARTLFEAFTQEDQTTTRKFGGTGLGLSISRKLVELMGGTINCDGFPGEGASFWFEVPLPVEDGEPESRLPSLEGLHVLCAGRSPTFLEAAVAPILRAGAAVLRLNTATAAMELLGGATRRTPDAVVLEICREEMASAWFNRTPSEGGPTALGLPRGFQERIVAVLPEGPLRLMRRALAAGFNHVLMVPWTVDELVLSVAEAAGRKAVVPPKPEAPTSTTLAGVLADRAAGLRLLVLEDTPMNQVVARRQLETLGITQVEMAENGAIGLDLVKSGRFNLVISDANMPVMDGYDFTRALRAWEAETGRPRLPVIAMTANALQGDAEACFQAGMDDYLSKPVKIEHLAEMLRRWTKPAGRQPAPAHAPAPAPGPAPVADSIPIGVRLAAAAAQGTVQPAAPPAAPQAAPLAATVPPAQDPVRAAPDRVAAVVPLAPEPAPGPAAIPPINHAEFVSILGFDDPVVEGELLGLFREALPELVGSVREALTAEDRMALKLAAHRAKGAARNVAASALGDVMERLEKEARSGGWADLRAAAAMADRLADELEAYIAGRGAAA